MTREHTGKYSAKHPIGTHCDEDLARLLADGTEDGRLTCSAAHAVAAEAGVAPSKVGETADLLEYRIVECQLGLFGYSPAKRIVKPAAAVSPELRGRLEGAVVDGRIGCSSCWKIAEDLGIGRPAVGDACELLGFKVERCQLGAF